MRRESDIAKMSVYELQNSSKLITRKILVTENREIKLRFSRNFLQKRLMKAAKEEMARQEVRNKLQQADNEVMEAYRKITAARSKKKPPTKKEREQAWKALKEREIILRQLESI